MLADPLTKSMSSDRSVEGMMTGRFDMGPTAETLMIKEKNRACRKAAEQTTKAVSPPVNRLKLTPSGHWSGDALRSSL